MVARRFVIFSIQEHHFFFNHHILILPSSLWPLELGGDEGMAGARRGAGQAAALRRRGQLLAAALVMTSCAVVLVAKQLREGSVGATALLRSDEIERARGFLDQRKGASTPAAAGTSATGAHLGATHDQVAGDHHYRLIRSGGDGISAGLVGSLEKAMDTSIDNKVNAFLSAPAIGSMPVPEVDQVGYWGPDKLPGAEHARENASHEYLRKLQAQKRQLERQKARLLSDLASQKRAAAIQAARDSIGLNEQRLARATAIARKRVSEQAQQAASAMAKKMQEAAIAKQAYNHAVAVADKRIGDLDAMVHSTNNYGQEIAKAAGSSLQQLPAATAPIPASEVGKGAPHAVHVEYAGSIVEPMAGEKPAAIAGHAKHGALARGERAVRGTRLYRYLKQEKELERKIRAAERAARKKAAADAVPSQTSATVENGFIRTIAKALLDNKKAIHKDEAAAGRLKQKQEALYASMKALKTSDELLFRKVNHFD